MNLLLKITYGATAHTWSTGQVAQTHGGDVYAPEPGLGVDGEFVASGDSGKDDIKVSVPAANALAQALLGQTAQGAISVTIFQQIGVMMLVRWKGRVASFSAADGVLSMNCSSIATMLEKGGKSRPSLKMCPYAVYDTEDCKVPKASFEAPTTIVAATGRTVTVGDLSAYAATWFVGGIFDYDGVLRYISGHTGDVLTLNRPFPSVTLTDPVKIYPGCPGTLAACRDKFNNILNHGGQPWKKDDNIFRLTSVV